MLAASYILSGGSRGAYCGEYVATAARCNGLPVFRFHDDTGDNHYLFQPFHTDRWEVNTNNSPGGSNCPAARGSIAVHGSCPNAPHESGCFGLWEENTGSGEHEWSRDPSIVVFDARRVNGTNECG